MNVKERGDTVPVSFLFIDSSLPFPVSLGDLWREDSFPPLSISLPYAFSLHPPSLSSLKMNPSRLTNFGSIERGRERAAAGMVRYAGMIGF